MLASHYNSGASADADGHSRHHLVSKQHHVIMARHPQVSSGWSCDQEDPNEAGGDRSEADSIQSKDGACQQIDPSSNNNISTLDNNTVTTTSTNSFVSRSNCSSTATVQEGGEEEVDEVEELLQNSVCFNSKFLFNSGVDQRTILNGGNKGDGNSSSHQNQQGERLLQNNQESARGDCSMDKIDGFTSRTNSNTTATDKLVHQSSVVANILSEVLEEKDQFGLAYLHQSECRSNCSSSNSSSGISCSNRSHITSGTRSSSSSSSASETNMENLLQHKNNNSGSSHNTTPNMVGDSHNGDIDINGILRSTINSGMTNSSPVCVGGDSNTDGGLLSNFCLTSSLLKQIHNGSDSGGGSSRKSSEGDEPVSLGNINSYGYSNARPDATGDMIDADQLAIANHGVGYDGYSASQFNGLRSGVGPGFSGYNHDNNGQFAANTGTSSGDASLSRLSSLVNGSSLFKAATGIGGSSTPEDEMKLLLPDLLRKRENSGSSRDSGYSSYFGTGTSRVHPTPSNNFNSSNNNSSSSILDSALLSHLSRLTGGGDPSLLLNNAGLASALSSNLPPQLDDAALNTGTAPFLKTKPPSQETFDLNNLSSTNFSALSRSDATLPDVSLTQTMPDASSSFTSGHGMYNLPSNNYDSRAFNSTSLTTDDDSIFSALSQNMSSEANASLMPNQHFMDKFSAIDDARPSSWLNLEALLFKNGNTSNGGGSHSLGPTDSGRMSVASVSSMDPLLASAHKLERMATAPNGFRMNPNNDYSLRPSSVQPNHKEPTMGQFGASKFQTTNEFLSYQNSDYDEISQLLSSDPGAQEKFLDNFQLLNQLSNLSLETDRRLHPPAPPIAANNATNNHNNNGFFNFSRSHSSVNFPTGQHHQTGPSQPFGPHHQRPMGGPPHHHQHQAGQYQQQTGGQYPQHAGPNQTSANQGQQGAMPDGFLLSQLLEKSMGPANNASPENSSFSSSPNNEKLAELASVLLNSCKVSTIDISLSEVQLMLRRASLNDPFARNWLSRNFEFQRILSKAGITKRFSMPPGAAGENSTTSTGPTYPSMYSNGNRQAFGDKYINSNNASQGRMPPPKSQEYTNWTNGMETNGGSGPESMEAMRQMSMNAHRPDHRSNNGAYHPHHTNGVDNFGRVAGGSSSSSSYGNDSSNTWNLDNYKITSLGNGGYITSKNCANFEKLTMHSSSKELPQHFSAPPPTPVASALPQGKGAFPFPPSTPRPSSLKDYPAFDQLNSSQLEFALNNIDIASAAATKLGRDGFLPPHTHPHHRLLQKLPLSELMALNVAAAASGGKASTEDAFTGARQRIPPEILAAAAASNQGLGGSSSGALPPHLAGSGSGAQPSDLSGAARGLAAALGGGRHSQPSLGPDSFFRPDMMPFQHNHLAYQQLGPLPPLVYSLLQRIEDCYDQFRQVERQRKKTEAELARCFPGRRVSSSNTISLPRLPHNPTRLDRLVLDHMREHARVITLVAKMERLRNAALQPGIHKSLSKWHSTLTTLTTLRHADITHIILPPHLLHQHHHHNSYHHHPGHPPPSLHNPLHSPPPGPGSYQQYSNVEKVYGNPPSVSNISQPPPPPPTPSTQGPPPHPAMMTLQHLMSSPPPPISSQHTQAAMQQQASNCTNSQPESATGAGNADDASAAAVASQSDGTTPEVSSSSSVSQQHGPTTAGDNKQLKEEGPPEVVALSQCLCRVVQATRGARTALYCALTLTTLQHLAPADSASTDTVSSSQKLGDGAGMPGHCVAGTNTRQDSTLGTCIATSISVATKRDSTQETRGDHDKDQEHENDEDIDDDDEEEEEDEEEEDDDLKLVEALKKLFQYRDLMKKMKTMDDSTATSSNAVQEPGKASSSGSSQKNEAAGVKGKPTTGASTTKGGSVTSGIKTTTAPSKAPETTTVHENAKKGAGGKQQSGASSSSSSNGKNLSANVTQQKQGSTATDTNKKDAINGARVSSPAHANNKSSSVSTKNTSVTSTTAVTSQAATSSTAATNGSSKNHNTSNAANTSTSVTGSVSSKPSNTVSSSSTQASNSGNNRTSGHNNLFGSGVNNGRKYFNGFGNGGPANMSAHYAKLGMATQNRRPPFHHHPPPPHHHNHHHQQPHHNNHYHHHRSGGANINAAAVIASNLNKVNSINVPKVAAASSNNRDLRSSVTY